MAEETAAEMVEMEMAEMVEMAAQENLQWGRKVSRCRLSPQGTSGVQLHRRTHMRTHVDTCHEQAWCTPSSLLAHCGTAPRTLAEWGNNKDWQCYLEGCECRKDCSNCSSSEVHMENSTRQFAD